MNEKLTEFLKTSGYRVSTLKRVSRSFIRISPEDKLQCINKDGHCETPIRYLNGSIAYDNPERVPQYLKEAVATEFEAAFENNNPFTNDYKERGS